MLMEDIIGIIVVIFVVLGIGIVFVVQFLKKKKQTAASWTGTVVDKEIDEQVHSNHSSGNDNSGFNDSHGTYVTHSYNISVRADSGETFEWPISSGFYETVGIGDKLSKPAGTMMPEIVEKAAPAQAPAPQQTPPPTPPQGPITPIPPSV